MTLTCHLLLPLNNNTDYNSCKTFSFLIYHKQNFIVIFCLKEVCTLIYNGRNQLASITTRLRCIKQIYCIFVQFWYKKNLLNPLNSRFYCLLMKGHCPKSAAFCQEQFVNNLSSPQLPWSKRCLSYVNSRCQYWLSIKYTSLVNGQLASYSTFLNGQFSPSSHLLLKSHPSHQVLVLDHNYQENHLCVLVDK